jgi:tight adherence protein B
MDALTLLIGVLVFCSVASCAWYVASIADTDRQAVRRRVAGPPLSEVSAPLDVLLQRGSRLPFADRLPLSREARDRMGLELEHAGEPFRVSEYLAIRMTAAAAGAAGGLLVATVLGLPTWARIVIPLVLILPGWSLPTMYVSRRTQQRQDAFNRQLPDALTAIGKSLRVGSGLLQALGYAADEVPAPLGAELRRTLRELQLGGEPDLVFNNLSRRVGSKDMDIAITAILIQRDVGGNLSEILSNVTNTIRERAKLHAEIKVMTSRQRLTGNLVAVLPVAVAVLFIAVNPKMGRLLIDNGAGQISLAIGVGFELLGLWLIRRLSVIEV